MKLKNLYIIVFVFLLHWQQPLISQNLNRAVLNVAFETGQNEQRTKRKLLKFKKKVNYFNPLAFAGAGLMYIYQNAISEQIQATCMYETSCSEFTKLSIGELGLLFGLLKGFNQLSECHPGAFYEHPQVFTRNRKIINRVDKGGK